MATELDVLATNVRKRREELGLASSELSRLAGLDRSYVSSIENASRGSYPKLVTVEKLAKALRVTPDQLMGRAPVNVPTTPYDRNPSYRKLIDGLERLPRPDREKFLQLADWIIFRTPSATDDVLEFVPAKPVEPRREMPESQLRDIAVALGDVVEFRRGARWKEYEVPLVASVSAGSGIEIFETYEKVRQIPEYYWQAGVRAVFKVVGHSMLDMGITDKDLLFVRPTDKPKSGEVVICSLNGAAFVKEFERGHDGVRLVSHNPEYQPMAVGDDDDLRIFGVVVGRTGDLSGGRRSVPNSSLAGDAETSGRVPSEAVQPDLPAITGIPRDAESAIAEIRTGSSDYADAARSTFEKRKRP